MDNIVFLLENIIVWSTLLTATFCYGLLMNLCFFSKYEQQWYDRVNHWSGSIRAMLAALPLLGLLGTISGLMKTFTHMAVDRGFSFQEVISGGIAEAMFTTQLGLVLVVPGLLLMAFLNARKNSWLASLQTSKGEDFEVSN